MSVRPRKCAAGGQRIPRKKSSVCGTVEVNTEEHKTVSHEICWQPAEDTSKIAHMQTSYECSKKSDSINNSKEIQIARAARGCAGHSSRSVLELCNLSYVQVS